MSPDERIRVLLVEDSRTTREYLTELLKRDPRIEIAGWAGDGVEAVEMTKRLRPNVVVMDIQMPRMNGLEATKQIMVEAPTPVVVVSAVVDTADVHTSMRALRSGALAVLRKPEGPRSEAFARESQQFVRTVKAMAEVKVVRHQPSRLAAAPPMPRSAEEAARKTHARVVAIATSTGGPAALHTLISELPGDFPAPILVVQHIATGFSEGLASWLNSVGALRVKVAEDGEPLYPGTVYLAPDEYHLGVSDRETIQLSSEAPIGGFRPSGTYLFNSVAQVFGRSAVGAILTGMGQDGVEGLAALRRAGGYVIAQDADTCVVNGMPAAAIAAGLTDAVLPLGSIPAALTEATR